MGQRGKPCPVCIGDQVLLDQINASFQAGSGASALAKLFPYGKDQLQRHKKHTVPSPVPTVNLGEPIDEIALSDARLARWILRSESAYVASAQSGDLRGLIESLRSGLRSELELRRRLERKVEQASCTDSPEKDGAITINFLDRVIRDVQILDAQRGYPPCPICGHGSVSLAEIKAKLPAILSEVEKYEHNVNGTN